MKHRLLLLLLFMFVTSAVGWAQKSAPLSFTVKGILLDSLTQENRMQQSGLQRRVPRIRP